MNALVTPVAVKDEVWHAEGFAYVHMTRTPGAYDTGAPLFFGITPTTIERARRFADCVSAFAGVDDPVAYLSYLRQIEQRWNAITEAPARAVALLGEGVGSLLPDHEAAEVCKTYEDVQRGPAPWIVVDCYPSPLLFLTPDGVWAGLAEKAELHFDYEDAVDRMQTWGGEIAPLEWVRP